MLLAVELVDVSFDGMVRFENVLLSNVTLMRGAVVSTTINDYSMVPGSYARFYAYDDASYDVAVIPVPLNARDDVGADFRIADGIVSDCIGMLVLPGTSLPVPGCSEAVWPLVERVKNRAAPAGGSVETVALDQGTSDDAGVLCTRHFCIHCRGRALERERSLHYK